MTLKNTPNAFGWLAKTFHWVVALCIITLWVVGTLMTDMENTPTKFTVYGLHKAVGIVVLALAVLRLTWKAVSIDPAHVGARWQARLATFVHNALYVCMFLMPLSGWAMSSAAGYPVSVFGLFTMPELVAKDVALKELFKEAHELIGNAILALVAMHAGAALLHHFVYKDGVLKRMLP